MKKPVLLITLLSLVLAFAAAPAGAASVREILNDCSRSPDGMLRGDYSKSDLRKARDGMSGDTMEYTGCYDAIAARLSARPRARTTDGGDSSNDGSSGGGSTGDGTGTGSDWYDATGDGSGAPAGGSGGGTGGSSGGSGAAGAGDPDSVTSAPVAPPVEEAGSNAAVELAGADVTPGFALDDEARPLPTPLIVFLVLLAIGAVGIGLPTIGRRVLARRRA